MRRLLSGGRAKLLDYLRAELPDLELSSVRWLVFSVPGTVDWTDYHNDELHIVKNMPSFSPKFRGFDFKVPLWPHTAPPPPAPSTPTRAPPPPPPPPPLQAAFQEDFPFAKISAVAVRRPKAAARLKGRPSGSQSFEISPLRLKGEITLQQTGFPAHAAAPPFVGSQDNMAAALGVAAHDPTLTNALVLALGTAPSVSTFFRDSSWDAKDHLPEPSAEADGGGGGGGGGGGRAAVNWSSLPLPKFLETGAPASPPSALRLSSLPSAPP
eukprot:SAG11_NODE_3560_length_2371_cov_2.872359_1_plen_267_part_10